MARDLQDNSAVSWLPVKPSNVPICSVHHSWRCPVQHSHCNCTQDVLVKQSSCCSQAHQECTYEKNHPISCHNHACRQECPCPLRCIMSCKWTGDQSNIPNHLDKIHKVRVVYEVTKLILNARSNSNNEMFAIAESRNETYLCSCFVSEMLGKLIVIVQNAGCDVQDANRPFKVMLCTRDGEEVLSRLARTSSSAMEETCGSGSFVALDLGHVQKLIDTKGDLGLILKVKIVNDIDIVDTVAINVNFPTTT